MKPLRHFRFFAVTVSLGFLAGCATAGDPRDPLEPVNRVMFNFNVTASNVVLTPAADAYRSVAPELMQEMVLNFFSNLSDTVVLTSSILQGKYIQSLSDFSRIVWNTSLGLGGLFDVASHMDLPKHQDDLGQAFASWGIGSGPYLVIPFLGPSTLRDGVGIVGSWYINPLYEYYDVPVRNSAVAFQYFSRYAGSYYSMGKIIDEAALDSYVFVREGYFQRSRVQSEGEGSVFITDDPGNDRPSGEKVR
jgi:phospholipid-binding lipoprotein MlaA